MKQYLVANTDSDGFPTLDIFTEEEFLNEFEEDLTIEEAIDKLTRTTTQPCVYEVYNKNNNEIGIKW